ncbi:diguanylate cyclase [Lacimicrobium alkaliphilum]|uniref:diguanylate cyclase n=1 Tax=Lacimicrobium alkaliphilum TaxID=1526571 RepID=A0ABQ1QXT6_9ALTE|nr:diguanylate cyclase [Lacimicrobium alkaliphilum]GGD51201.1 diguanylate cyclase response regulator [Lacimicrobium alkaliphilum]
MSERQQILIIDDETDNLRILSDILRDQADIILAKSGQQGIRKAAELKPDLILLDVIMQGLDGFEVMSALQHDATTCDIPVIFITALGDTHHEEKGFHLGACDYIQKPFHTTIVLARIKLHLELRRQRNMLEQLANIDPLTSIANRRRFEDVLKREWRVAMRKQSPISLILVDIDDFKHYNDHFGHAAGDKVLQKVSAAFSSRLQRPRDLVARFGGEEFIILLPDNDRQGCMDVMEQCRQGIEEMPLDDLQNPDICHITVSIGGYTCRPDTGSKPKDAIKMADDMLYMAKHQGKNRILWFCENEGIKESPAHSEQGSVPR